jgi:hypothetical protein
MSLDGEEVARLKFRERAEIEVTTGKHRLEGKNELGKSDSLEFSARDGETVTVHIGGIPMGCSKFLMGILPPSPTIVMKLGDGW